MNWLKKFSEKKNTSQKVVIKGTLKKYKEEEKRKQLVQSFKRATLDKNMIEIAEEGLDDYINQLESH